jgi:hypothetical protein
MRPPVQADQRILRRAPDGAQFKVQSSKRRLAASQAAERQPGATGLNGVLHFALPHSEFGGAAQPASMAFCILHCPILNSAARRNQPGCRLACIKPLSGRPPQASFLPF